MQKGENDPHEAAQREDQQKIMTHCGGNGLLGLSSATTVHLLARDGSVLGIWGRPWSQLLHPRIQR